jgi:serine/threonine protein kinase
MDHPNDPTLIKPVQRAQSSPGPIQTFANPEVLTPGAIIDNRYEVLSLLGKGGCGCVYKVQQVVMKRPLALKTLNQASSEYTAMRLQKEAQALSRLEHPNIVQAIDFGMIHDLPFFVMEFVDGLTLSQYLQQRSRLSVDEVVELFLPIALALSYAQGKGIVHRDLKPSNIILAHDPARLGKFIPKLVDFGIAKIQYGDETAAQLTRTGEIFGTPLYMSPEQCAGSGADHRSDIYSLGCVMFEALTGTPPYAGSNPLEILMRHVNAEIPTLKEASLGADFPPGVEQIVQNMLAKSPDDRYQSCAKLVEDLLALQAGSRKIEATGATTNDDGARKRRKLTYLLTGLAALLLVTASVAVINHLLKPQQAIRYFTGKEGNRNRPNLSEKEGAFRTGSDILATINETEKVGLSPGPQFFSKDSGQEVSFTIPGDVTLGNFRYWRSAENPVKVPVKGTFTVPKDAKLIIYALPSLVEQPGMWSQFRPGDLAGIRIDFSEAMTIDKFDDKFDDILQIGRETKGDLVSTVDRAKKKLESDGDMVEPALKNQNLNSVIGFDGLRLIGLIYADFTDRSWMHMGTLPNLRWIWLDNAKLNGKPPKGEDFTRLLALSKLHVLSVDKLLEPGPMLKELAKNDALKRLSLGDVRLSKTDLDLIAKIPNLDTLRLRKLSLDENASLEQLAKLPHLERLAIEEVQLANPSMLKHFEKFAHLKELIIQDSGEPDELSSVKVRPGCQVTFRRSSLPNWFDWMAVNPDVYGLW